MRRAMRACAHARRRRAGGHGCELVVCVFGLQFKILIRAKPPHTSDGAPAHLQTSPRGHGPPQRARGTPAQKQATHAASSNSPDAGRHVARAGVHVATTPARPGPRHPPPLPSPHLDHAGRSLYDYCNGYCDRIGCPHNNV